MLFTHLSIELNLVKILVFGFSC